MVSKDFFKSYSLLYGKSMEAKDPEGLAKLEPRGMLYVGDHQTLLYTKYISCGPYGHGIEDFYSISNYKSKCRCKDQKSIQSSTISPFELLIPMYMTRFHRRGFIGRIYVGNH